MIPDPLHPAVVHLPVALALLLPFAAAFVFLAMRRDRLTRGAWLAVAACAVLLVASSWAALETGEEEEERVERVVAERWIEEHEEAAELFFALAIAAAAASLVGLAGGRFGDAARGVSLLVLLATLVAAVNVGHAGGELVYKHGAAAAYTQPDSVRRAHH